MQNAHVLLDAPLAFAAVLLIAFGLAYWIVSLRFQGTLDSKDGTIEALKTQLSGLQDQIKSLRDELSSKLATTQQPSSPARDPDGIYQFGAQVGEVRMAQIDESRGLVTFGSIVGAMKLNTKLDFEYRDFLLRLKSIQSEGHARMMGQFTGRTLNAVTCEIVGRVSYQ